MFTHTLALVFFSIFVCFFFWFFFSGHFRQPSSCRRSEGIVGRLAFQMPQIVACLWACLLRAGVPSGLHCGIRGLDLMGIMIQSMESIGYHIHMYQEGLREGFLILFLKHLKKMVSK